MLHSDGIDRCDRVVAVPPASCPSDGCVTPSDDETPRAVTAEALSAIRRELANGAVRTRQRDKDPDDRNLQPPDRFSQHGAEYYGSQNFAEALEMYGEAIDKLHTMYVFPAPQDRHRQPSVADEPILQGFVSSLGAALAMNPGQQVQQRVERTVNYLGQIAQLVQRENQASADPYLTAIEEIANLRG